MNDDPQRADPLEVFTAALKGADRVVVQTRNAIGGMDSHYQPAAELAARIRELEAAQGVRLTPMPPECAPKGVPVLVAGGIAMKKTGGQWFTGMEEPAFERPIEWEVKWWSPIPQQNEPPALTPAPVTVEEAARVLLPIIEEKAAAIPEGHENTQRGASSYNWWIAFVIELRALSGEEEE